MSHRIYKKPTHEEIAVTAFCLWEKAGKPNGKDMHFWLRAEKFEEWMRGGVH